MELDRLTVLSRNLLAFSLVASFVGGIIAFTFYAIPEGNRDTITYMVGQLSGMATMALGFYFVDKATNSKGTGKNPMVVEGVEDMIPIETKGAKS